MDEAALQGFLAALWGLARLAGASGTLIAGLVFFFRALFPPREGTGASPYVSAAAVGPVRPAAARGPALPRRPGARELGAVCAGAMTRGYYRSLVAERLRALGRDALALNEDISEEEAYRRLRQGGYFLDGDSDELLFGDHFAAPRARGATKPWPWFRYTKAERRRDADASFVTPFLTRVEAYLNALSDYMRGSGGNDGQHKG